MIRKLATLVLLIVTAECQRFNAQDATLAMLERVNEPLFIPKCEKGVMLEVPPEYMPNRYQSMANSLNNRFGGGDDRTRVRIPIKKIQIPDVSDLMTLPRLGAFSTFMPRHRKLSARLITLFTEMRTVEDFFALAAYLRDRINPSLFVYAFSVAIMNRQDTRNVRLPPVSETFPARYVDGSVFVRAREESMIMSDSLVNMRAVIEIPQDYTATLLEPEHRLAYFREDLGINLHHWHWHLIYPFNGPREVVQKNRRGELFYYAHQQIIARYDFERLCNKMPRTIRLQNFNEPIPEAYFPKLSAQTASRNWQSRPGGLTLRDVNRNADELKVDIADLERWRARILEAIQQGRVQTANGTNVPLSEENGIDILGDMMEPSDYSVNRQLYGDLHNLLHVAIALIHDPDHRHLETFSVVGESNTAMRDPVFYRIHSLVQDIFNQHKQNLARYTVQQLEFQGVQVGTIEISARNTAQRNTFMTFWQKSTVDLSRGMDFFPRGPLFARFTHLQHAPFTLNVDVNNSGPRRQALVRVFLAPKHDERGRDMAFVEQRNLFIEIDKFLFDLQPGANKIVRNSFQSTVSIPFEQTFRDLEAGRPANNATSDTQDNFNFCGCGWPHHMLIPKGSVEGFASVLFVMISNAETDWNPRRNPASNVCAEASAYCGIRGELYPDRRAMGYPFDRLPRQNSVTLQTFLTPNMGIQDVVIRFNDTTVDNTPNNGQQPRTQIFPPSMTQKPRPAITPIRPPITLNQQGAQPRPQPDPRPRPTNTGRPGQTGRGPNPQPNEWPWARPSNQGRPPTTNFFDSVFGSSNQGNGRAASPIYFPSQGQGFGGRW